MLRRDFLKGLAAFASLSATHVVGQLQGNGLVEQCLTHIKGDVFAVRACSHEPMKESIGALSPPELKYQMTLGTVDHYVIVWFMKAPRSYKFINVDGITSHTVAVNVAKKLASKLNCKFSRGSC